MCFFSRFLFFLVHCIELVFSLVWLKLWFYYSSNEIRKTQNEPLKIICKNLNSQKLWIYCQSLTFFVFTPLAFCSRNKWIIWWPLFGKKLFQFWWEIWVIVTLLQLSLTVFPWGFFVDWLYGFLIDDRSFIFERHNGVDILSKKEFLLLRTCMYFHMIIHQVLS